MCDGVYCGPHTTVHRRLSHTLNMLIIDHKQCSYNMVPLYQATDPWFHMTTHHHSELANFVWFKSDWCLEMHLPLVDLLNLQEMRHVFLYISIPSIQASSISFNLCDTPNETCSKMPLKFNMRGTHNIWTRLVTNSIDFLLESLA